MYNIRVNNTGIQRMTTWAIQPKSTGEFNDMICEFVATGFEAASDMAFNWSQEIGEPITIWRVGTISQFRWMDVEA
jgi:hypothetical protein